jgi:hypothetical protein
MQLTFPTLRDAIENRDGKTLASFYADDAVMQIVDQDNPPSHPREIKGLKAITSYFDDVCGRAMTHRVENGVFDGKHLSFTQACTYPDGKRVLCAATLEIAKGKIAKEVAVQVWDA